VLNDVRLRVVHSEFVRAHEIADAGREQRIEHRLREDGMLRDPLLVGEVPDVDGYVLLDGTNRKAALQALGLPGVMVQIIDYSDTSAVQLRTWCHAAPLLVETIRDQAQQIPGVRVEKLLPLEAQDALASRETLAVILDHGRRYVIRREGSATIARSHQLRELVDIYEDRLTRVDCEPEGLEERAHATGLPDGDPSTLIAFPQFTRAQVVSLAMSGSPIPAGITRHIITGGRALRVNLPLEVLTMAEGSEVANLRLQRHLTNLRPRLYREPTILFDS
jgi:hypothetical protein